MKSVFSGWWKYYIISQTENEMIANDDASNNATKTLQRDMVVSRDGDSMAHAFWHRTSIQRVSPFPDENCFSINFDVNKHLKGMAIMLENKIITQEFSKTGVGDFESPRE